jgi:NAD-dependent dihydropyrimidine dehydrogenase PreA subunit
VVINQAVCTGCKYCVFGCPFDIPRFDAANAEGAGVDKAYKCTMCFDRQSIGMEPACTKTCPTGALSFISEADLPKITSAAKEKGMSVYDGGALMTHVVFLLEDSPSAYGLPAKPAIPTPTFLWRTVMKPVRLTSGERFFHWLNMGTFIVLALTGTGLYARSTYWLTFIFGGVDQTRTIHHYAGLLFIVTTLIIFFQWFKEYTAPGEDTLGTTIKSYQGTALGEIQRRPETLRLLRVPVRDRNGRHRAGHVVPIRPWQRAYAVDVLPAQLHLHRVFRHHVDSHLPWNHWSSWNVACHEQGYRHQGLGQEASCRMGR